MLTAPGFKMPADATDCHVHIFDPERFPYSAARRYTPPPADVDDLLRLHDRLGIQRAVLVQPSVYGTDNDCLLAALKRLGPRARGIAVIDRTFSRDRIESLVDGGVRGVRLNLEVSKSADASAAIELLQATADRLSGSGLLIQVYAAMRILLACAPTIRSLHHRVLIDHFGLARAAGGTAQEGFAELMALMASPNVYMKLSGPYQISTQAPHYADTAPIAQAMLGASPNRVVWGSDWPHTGGANRPADYKPTDIEPFRTEDDGRNLALVAQWAPDAAQRARLLALNPAQLFGFNS